MYQVRMAAIMAAIIVIFSMSAGADTPVGEGTVGAVSGASEQPVGTVGRVETPSGQPTTTPTAPVIQEQKGDTGPQGPQGSRGIGSPGRRGPQGPAGISFVHERNGKYTSHNGVYREIKSWNPVSVSHLEAKLAQNSQAQADRAYSKGLNDGSTKKTEPEKAAAPLPPAKSYDWSWLWRWLLPLLLIALLLWLLWLLSALFGGLRSFWNRIVGWFRREPKEPEPDMMTNTGGGSAFGVEQESAKISCYFKGVIVQILKGVLAGKPGSPWIWAKAGEDIAVNGKFGQLKRFILAIENLDHFPVPSDSIMVKDELASSLPHKVEAGAIYLGSQKLRDMTPEELNRLTSGELIPVGDYIGKIPVGETFAFRYDVRVTSGSIGGNVRSTVAGSGDGDLPSTGPEFDLDEIMATREKAAKAEAEAKAKAEAKPAEAEVKPVTVEPEPVEVGPNPEEEPDLNQLHELGLAEDEEEVRGNE